MAEWVGSKVLRGLSVAGNISTGGTLTFNNSVANTTLTIGGNITSAPAVAINATTTGAGNNNNIILNGTNSYTGPTTITVNTGSAGNVQIARPAGGNVDVAHGGERHAHQQFQPVARGPQERVDPHVGRDGVGARAGRKRAYQHCGKRAGRAPRRCDKPMTTRAFPPHRVNLWMPRWR